MGHSHPDQLLLSRTARGDERAFRALYDRHQARVFRLAQGVLRDASEARVVVQEVFLRLHKIAPEWTDRAPLPAWLHKTTLQQAPNLRRTLFRFRRRRPARATDHVGASATEGPAIARELLDRLNEQMSKLSAKQRAVVTLHLDLGLAPKQIAEAMDISANSARVTLHRALSTLKKAVEEAPAPPIPLTEETETL